MNGDSIPDPGHVLRHVKARFIQGEEIDGSAFRLRDNERELSFNWMEHYRNQTPDQQLQLIRDTFPLTLKKKDRFVKLNVGSAKHHVNSEHPEKKTIDFTEDGDAQVPSHCLMTGQPDHWSVADQRGIFRQHSVGRHAFRCRRLVARCDTRGQRRVVHHCR
jgi:hypothetical protein